MQASNLETLKGIRAQVDANQDFIHIDSNLMLTKGKMGKATGVLFRNKGLEQEVRAWLESRVSFKEVMARYKKYDKRLETTDWPKHIATHFVRAEGTLAKLENIFMFFPEVLGVHTADPEDYFGFEFIDAWVSVFDEIVIPCMRRLFVEEDVEKLYMTLRPSLEKTIFLAAIFHEIGHRVSCWKVSPGKDNRVQINKFHTDVMGELSTDTLLVNFLKEFPEIKYYVFLQRLFWFGRFGFAEDSIHGKLNTDNDTWIGSYLWNHYLENGVITINDQGKLSINFEKLNFIFSKVLEDIDSVEARIVTAPKDKQDDVIHQWMCQKTAFINGQFCYPESMRVALKQCVDLPQRPTGKF